MSSKSFKIKTIVATANGRKKNVKKQRSLLCLTWSLRLKKTVIEESVKTNVQKIPANMKIVIPEFPSKLPISFE